jgi:hypothetical protein
MAKSAEDKDKRPKFWATVIYKLWVREQYEIRGWSLAEFAKQLKRIDRTARATSGGLSLFLSPKAKVPEPSNTTLMPAINRLFGKPEPQIYDPHDRLANLRDAVAQRWARMNDSERRILEALIAFPDGEGDDRNK